MKRNKMKGGERKVMKSGARLAGKRTWRSGGGTSYGKPIIIDERDLDQIHDVENHAQPSRRSAQSKRMDKGVKITEVWKRMLEIDQRLSKVEEAVFGKRQASTKKAQTGARPRKGRPKRRPKA